MTREEALARANDMIAAKVSALVTQALRDRDALAGQIMAQSEAQAVAGAQTQDAAPELTAAVEALDTVLGGFAATMGPAVEMEPDGETCGELIARARTWTAGDCSFETTPTLALIKDLVDALEAR